MAAVMPSPSQPAVPATSGTPRLRRRLAALVVDGGCEREAEQPRAERRLAAVLRQFAVAAQERLLRRVFGVGMVAEHAIGD
jgi:hypothetical protein